MEKAKDPMEITDTIRAQAKVIGITSDEGIRKTRAAVQTLNEIIQEEGLNTLKELERLGIPPTHSVKIVCRQVKETLESMQHALLVPIILHELFKDRKG